MNTKINFLVITILLINTQIFAADTRPMLVINLASTATIDGQNIKLGQIADMAGDQVQALMAKDVALGRISVPGQKITIERSTITSRLASEKIDCRPVFAGAESVEVSQKTSTISVENFIDSAASFLAANCGDEQAAKWEVIRKPAEMTFANTKGIELQPKLVSKTAGGQATVEVSVVSGGKSLGTRQIVFDAKYNAKRAVAVTAIKSGEIITKENTRIENFLSDEPQSTGWTVPYGLTASRNLQAGTVISQSMAKQAKPQVKVERNQNVVIKIEMPGFTVTASGMAMQQGAAGESIKVRNIDSQRIIQAKINEDGTVEPVF